MFQQILFLFQNETFKWVLELFRIASTTVCLLLMEAKIIHLCTNPLITATMEFLSKNLVNYRHNVAYPQFCVSCRLRYFLVYGTAERKM